MKRNEKGPVSEIESVLQYYEDDFSKEIKQKGKEIYKSGKVSALVKHNHHYKAKVVGKNDTSYTVDICLNLEEGFADYKCNCPCNYPCKHIYAVMLGIKDNSYNEVELKAEEQEKKLTIQEFIERIPAEELKGYLMSDASKECATFNEEVLEQRFSKYLPKKNYKYYYNNLYNALVLDGYNHELLENYMRKIQETLSNHEYIEAYYVCKAIIEASKDTGNINKWDDLIYRFPVLGMNLRIIYRKADEELKTTIGIWMKILKKKNYYDCVYLEDIVLSVK